MFPKFYVSTISISMGTPPKFGVYVSREYPLGVFEKIVDMSFPTQEEQKAAQRQLEKLGMPLQAM